MDEGLRHGFRLGECVIDPEHRCVVRRGHRAQLSPLSMDFLMALAASPGDIVVESVLIDRLGCTSICQLERCLAELQQALGDSSARPRFVRRVGDVGYQLLATVQIDVPPVPTPAEILD